MRRPAILAAAVLLAGCASIDTHRTTCATQLGLAGGDPTAKGDAPSMPGGPVTVAADVKPQPTDPRVEACAQQRAAAERQTAGTVVAAILLGAAAGALSASSRPAYRPTFRYYRPAYRRGR